MAKVVVSLPEEEDWEEIEELLGEPVPLGGDTALLIRQDRRSH